MFNFSPTTFPSNSTGFFLMATPTWPEAKWVLFARDTWISISNTEGSFYTMFADRYRLYTNSLEIT